jgi:hypothetical protein
MLSYLTPEEGTKRPVSVVPVPVSRTTRLTGRVGLKEPIPICSRLNFTKSCTFP